MEFGILGSLEVLDDHRCIEVSSAKERLVSLAGQRVVRGLNGLIDGALDDPDVQQRAFQRARELHFMEAPR
ncbi:MAG: hypothetical protein LC799_13065 [Actinobacteria bacterium]|nr:hypothetical protein [Actinomycetota bacterium]